jgi:outer membrane receptor protein involved in Fe transport
MRKPTLLCVIIVFVISASAQLDGNRERRGNAQANGRLYGRVTDNKTNRGIEAASVQLLLQQRAAGATITDSLAGGMLTKPNGDFDILNLHTSDTFRLIISAIGYKHQELTVFFDGKKGVHEKDLGNIKLEMESQYLGAVTVTAQKQALQMGIDRKIFDVEKSLVSTGGTGIDVMKNIPSVSVDVDGNVLLRNSPPRVFIDGRPTILTLDQIPADNIEKVELITNPSAKFDAASTGGIINVVLKKNKRLGLNGIVSAGAGSPGILNGNLALNLREGKFNFYVNGNYNQGGGKARGETHRQNKDNGITTDYFNQYSTNKRNRRFGSVRFGVDYFLDNRNTLTLTQHFIKGRNTGKEEQYQEYLDVQQQPDKYGQRYGENSNQFNRSSTQFIFRHKFVETGKELTADINYNVGSGNDRSLVDNYYFNTDGTTASPVNQVRNNGSNNNDQLTVQIDFVDPYGENSKLETGVRTYINNFSSQFNAFSLSNGAEVKLPLSNNYKYREMVNAAYITYTGKLGSIGYQAGLRAEHSQFDGELIDSSRKFGYQYPEQIKNILDALFPSLYLSKNIGERQELQLNYSRRIQRPDFWQLNPFVDINDPFNIRQGNPALKPEFVNSIEFNYNLTYNSGSFLGVLYWRNVTDDITRYSDTISAAQYQQLNNAAVDPSAILNTFINAKSQNRHGAEFTLQQKLGEHVDFTPTINMQYNKVNASVGNVNLSNDGFNWEAKLIANYRVPAKSGLFKKLSFQATGEYESPEVLPQGRSKEQYSVDFALRKDFLKNNKATITFGINDVFNTLRFGNIYDTENFYQDTYRRRNVRSFRITFTYKFGSQDFSLFKRREGGDRGEENNRDNF